MADKRKLKRTDPIRARQLRQLAWNKPRQVLIEYRILEMSLSPDLDEKVRRLRTNDLKGLREGRDAALFAYGLESSGVVKGQVSVANSEAVDYDFVIHTSDGEADLFMPFQLKEVPPEDLNPDISLEDIYDKLEKYSGVDNLSVAIRISRGDSTLHYQPWTRETRPAISQLWLFGCKSKDQSTWFVCGDMLKRPRHYDFEYPSGP